MKTNDQGARTMKTERACTPKQEAFCLAYIKTGNACEAYRRAYDCESMSATTIKREAARLLDSHTITTTLAALRAPALQAAQVTLVGHLNDLLRLSEAALKAGNFSAAISAEIARGKAAGVYVEKSERALAGSIQTITRIELVSLE
jgi:phage terminase small subunit